MKLKYRVEKLSEDVINTVQLYNILLKEEFSFLLESTEGEEKIGRFSILGARPLFIYRVKGDEFVLRNSLKNTVRKGRFVHPFFLPREVLKEISVKIDLPVPFKGGWVGFLGYECISFFEPVRRSRLNILNMPDIYMIMPKIIFIFDHFKREIYFIEFNPQKNTIENILRKIKPLKVINPQASSRKPPDVKFILEKEEFIEMVKKAKRMIREGEIIQVVLSQILTVHSQVKPFEVYRILRLLNPSPYMFFLKFRDDIVFGSSPEMLVKKQGNIVYTRPIAGTRPRGNTDEEDKKFEKNLKNSIKEKAEHLMLVDLGRNDLGRVCREGTVKVEEFMVVEKYSHVMHLVSGIKGEVKRDKDSFAVIEACFPAGTVSGAPKVRASQIISELERYQRGPYAGCVGYFDFEDNMDTCITIRSLCVKKNMFFIQAGAGIVYDSRPQREYEETLNKACAGIEAIKLAEANFL